MITNSTNPYGNLVIRDSYVNVVGFTTANGGIRLLRSEFSDSPMSKLSLYMEFGTLNSHACTKEGRCTSRELFLESTSSFEEVRQSFIYVPAIVGRITPRGIVKAFNVGKWSATFHKSYKIRRIGKLPLPQYER